MDILPLALITGTLTLIVIAEFAMWTLFRRRIGGLLFPHELDASLFRFFTLTRLRLIALLHTFFLMVATTALYWLVW